jgi:hypothetical protein
MKNISLFILAAALMLCAGKAEEDYSGVYVGKNGDLEHTLDLATGGQVMHTINVTTSKKPEVVEIFKSFELLRGKWKEINGKIKILGFYKKSTGEETDALWVLEIEPNGDLIRHDEQGTFVRFQKR